MNHPVFNAYSIELDAIISYDATEVSSMKLYGYEFIDNLHFLRAPEEIISDASRCKELCVAVMDRFKNAGWEGTGCLSLLWIPPFAFPFKAEANHKGVVVWHVKQHEDGISWLLSPADLPFEEFS